MSDFQTQVNIQPAVAVAGDFASANPRASVLAGPGSLVAGPDGLTIGAFAWVDPSLNQAANTPFAGSTAAPNGFVGRQGNNGLITTFLGKASMVVPKGLPVTLFNAGDFWIENGGSAEALLGQKAYASLADGTVTKFATAGTAATAGASDSSGVIAAASTASAASSTIDGNILTTGPSVSNSFGVGAILTGSNVVSGTMITRQLTGDPGDAGTYEVSIPQTVVSTTISGTFGIMTLTGTITGTFGVGDVLSGTGVTNGTKITTDNGDGTYNVTPSQAASGNAITATADIETVWYCRSLGAPGELVKISSYAMG